MKSAWLKDVLREIGRSKSRFFSIFAIIALGAGFFCGLKATCPDMMALQRKYYAEQNLMDIRLLSLYGFSGEDLDAIRKAEDVRQAEGTYSKDVFIENAEGKNIVAKVMAMPEEINKLTLVEGRLPQKPDECAVEENLLSLETYEIGDTISVYTTSDSDPLSDSLSRDNWKVVGIMQSPQYVSYDCGTTDIGNGTVDFLLAVPKENFTYDVYTEVYVTFEDTKGLEAYTDAYDEAISSEKEKMEALADQRKEIRFDEIRLTAEKELDKAKKELTDGKNEAEEEFAKAKEELDEAFEELAKGKWELSEGRRKLEENYRAFLDGKETFEKEIADAEAQIADGWEAYYDGYEQYEEGRKQFRDGILDALLPEGGYAGLFDDITDLPSSILEAIRGRNQLSAAEEELSEAKTELEEAEKTLQEEKEKGLLELSDAEEQLKDGEKQLSEAEREWDTGWREYRAGLSEYREEKRKVDRELADAERKLADAEEELENLREPEWYVFTRDDNPGYTSYQGDAERIERVAKVFPFFFLMVALLVCLTTMTRMVEDERTEIGTLKALGYRPFRILSKYLIYSSAASISGAVFGIAVSSFLFPVIIYSAYKMMYLTHPMIFIPMVPMWVLITLSCLACSTAAVLMAGLSEMKAVPASLMRPKSPKAGKRVLLERVPFIWKRLSFTKKVTVRNLFRYKKRIFMTILGIAGCTALLLTGLGVYSSISGILEKQYGGVFRYDLITMLDTDASEKAVTDSRRLLENSVLVKKNLPVSMQTVDYKGISDTTFLVADDEETLSQMIAIRDHQTKKELVLPDDGVIITKRFSEIASLSVGDPIEFMSAGEKFVTKVSGIAENYTAHFFYMKGSVYEKLCGEAPEYNAVISILTDPSEETQEKISRILVGRDGILALSFVRTLRDNFSNMVENLTYVVILIIVCAALLAVIVLYNLTNINITERIREIATIKVLGFHDKEVSSYVFRENILLTLMGDGVGLIFGVVLFKFVIKVAEVDVMMFSRELPVWCFTGAFLLTVLFSLLVDLLMHWRLKKISMVESLKSVE